MYTGEKYLWWNEAERKLADEVADFSDNVIRRDVDEIERTKRGVFKVVTNKRSYLTRSILLAIGRRGTPRKLGVEGEEMAKDVIRRHSVLKDFFVKVLGIKEPAAEESACRMEHGVSPDILKRLVKFMEFLEKRSLDGKDIVREFEEFCGKKK